MIKCVAIDDEPIALSIIKEYCNRYGGIDLECFTSPVIGMEYIRANRPDIVFLDIEMKSHNGVALARELPEGTCLIFTTAYANYALDGFNMDAVDFLHKPIFYPRFEKAILKAGRFLRNSDSIRSEQSITLRVDYKNVVVNLKDIVVVEAMDNYVKIFRKEKSTIVSQITMKEIEARLPEDCFVRIHRSFIISIPFIEKFSNRTVFLHSFTRPIPAGRKYIMAFKNLNNIIQTNKNSFK